MCSGWYDRSIADRLIGKLISNHSEPANLITLAHRLPLCSCVPCGGVGSSGAAQHRVAAPVAARCTARQPRWRRRPSRAARHHHGRPRRGSRSHLHPGPAGSLPWHPAAQPGPPGRRCVRSLHGGARSHPCRRWRAAPHPLCGWQFALYRHPLSPPPLPAVSCPPSSRGTSRLPGCRQPPGSCAAGSSLRAANRPLPCGCCRAWRCGSPPCGLCPSALRSVCGYGRADLPPAGPAPRLCVSPGGAQCAPARGAAARAAGGRLGLGPPCRCCWQHRLQQQQRRRQPLLFAACRGAPRATHPPLR